MARRPPPGILTADEIHAIVFNTFGLRRFLQDGPIRPDVWERFLTLAARGQGSKPVSLILTPKSSRPVEGRPIGRATELTMALARRLLQRTAPPPDDANLKLEVEERLLGEQKKFRMAATSRYVVIDVTFSTLITDLLPLTDWWRALPQDLKDPEKLRGILDGFASSGKSIPEFLRRQNHGSFFRFLALAALTAFLSSRDDPTLQKLSVDIETIKRVLAPDLFDGGAVGSGSGGELDPDDSFDAEDDAEAGDTEASLAAMEPLWADYITLIKQIEPTMKRWNELFKNPLLSGSVGATIRSDTAIWAIQRNRRAMRQGSFDSNIPSTDVTELSRNTVKADAAWRLFAMSTSKLVWAVVDTGIDGLHPAFCNKSDDGSPLIDVDGNPVRDHYGWPLKRIDSLEDPALPKFLREDGTDVLRDAPPDNQTWQCWLSYDTLQLVRREENRLIVYTRDMNAEPDKGPFVRSAPFLKSRVRASLDFTLLRKIINGEWTVNEMMDRIPWSQLDVSGDRMARKMYLAKTIDRVRRHNLLGREVDWSLIEPLIRIDPHDVESRPRDPHGTHVAGIIGGDLPKGVETDSRPFFGVCPDIQLYDIRVFSDDEKDGGDEFTVLAALDYIAWVNRDPERPGIHGVNLSLAIRHVVDAHACGGTPVCDAANRMVWAGTAVVAAAGNFGFDPRYVRNSIGVGYRGMSIADPGNAEQVITVGATHRSEPHTYGVSYFSSRGPTGDGRVKPDIVAPGEKIRSCIPGQMMKVLDGTSMAAPHVSGVCALLMARHTELIAEPIRIKQIILRTATDLGRERYFQGAGLVDALRALQSL